MRPTHRIRNEEEGKKEYEVEKILNKKKFRGKN